jgi:hypothetical protein
MRYRVLCFLLVLFPTFFETSTQRAGLAINKGIRLAPLAVQQEVLAVGRAKDLGTVGHRSHKEILVREELQSRIHNGQKSGYHSWDDEILKRYQYENKSPDIFQRSNFYRVFRKAMAWLGFSRGKTQDLADLAQPVMVG